MLHAHIVVVVIVDRRVVSTVESLGTICKAVFSTSGVVQSIEFLIEGRVLSRMP